MAQVSLDTEFHGWNGSQEVSSVWHKGPTMIVSGTQICDRSSSSSRNIDYYVHIESERLSGSYGYPVTVSVVLGGTLQSVADTYGGVTYYGYSLDGGTVIREEIVASTGGTGIADFTGSFECTDNNTNVYVILWCNGGGTHNCDSSTWGHPNIVVGGIGTNELTPYNPYTAPSITLNSRKYKGEYNKTSDFWVKYTITPGSANIVRTVLEILDPNNNTAYQGYDNLSRTTGSEQTYYYTVSDSRLSGGGNYRIRLAVQDGTSTIYSNIENIFIYTKPSISIISNTDLGVYKKNNSYSVTYKITKGSENITNAVLQILNPSNNNVLASYNNLSKTAGSNQTYTYTLNSSNCRTWSLL